ncbi:hypothetical protein [Frigidibacter sp. ROC022]|uniref:hypothetical protein n=1 Tax=Frigidibacter sp. ROC022 TaxID=2971796 RepID=UPI00215B737F|nr:hypothetical protein [Frigidibacter sp. ROC022]MCR8725130.1 hypothetical protein [Frigidibacter sp. ROC022]
MTATTNKDFHNRVKRLQKRRKSSLTAGYLMSDNLDGYAVARVRRVERRSTLKGLVMVLALVVASKSVMVAAIGQDAYDANIARLAQGTASEKMAAFTMQADPLTSALAARIAPLLD